MKRKWLSRTAILAMVMACLAVSAPPVAAQNASAQLAVGSKHSTATEFNNAQELSNLSVSGSGASASVVFDDNVGFSDGFEDGSFTDSWSGDTGAYGVDSTVYSGSQALVYNGGGSSGGDDLYRSLSSGSVATADLWINISTWNSYHPEIAIEATTYTPGPYIGFNGSGVVEYYDGSAWQSTGIDLSTDTYYQISIKNIDYAANTYDIVVYDADGTVVGSYSGASFWNDISSADQLRFFGDGNVWHADDVTLQTGPKVETATYLSANHSVSNAEQAAINISTLSNLSAEITVEYWDGNSWAVGDSTTVTSTANHTLSLPSVASSTWRVNVTVDRTGSNPAFDLSDDSILFNPAQSKFSNPEPDDGATLSNYDGDISINVSDSDFDLVQSDTVTVTATDGSGTTIGSQTIASNSTVTFSYDPPPGSSTVTWTATDEYGEVATFNQDLTAPQILEIRNESAPESLVTNAGTIEVKFFGSNGTVITRTVSDGTVDFSGLPIDQTFIASVSADGYYDRRLRIPSLLEQQTIYLLPKNTTNVQVRFRLDDATGTYSESSILYIKKPITINNSTSYQIITSDALGVDGVTTRLDKGVRYTLMVKSANGDIAQLGAYDAKLNESVTLQPSVASVRPAAGSAIAYSANYSKKALSIGIEYVDPASETTSLTVSVVKRDGTVIKPAQTYTNPQSLSLSVPLQSELNQTAFVVMEGTRSNGEPISIREPVGPSQRIIVPPDLSNIWVQVGGGVALLLIGGVFSVLNASVGAVITALFAGVLWFLGILSGLASGAAVALAIGLATLNLILQR